MPDQMREQATTWSIELPLCPEAKGNSRRQFRNRRSGKLFSAKSEKARQFMRDAVCIMRSKLPSPFGRTDKLRLEVSVRYPNNRRDLDISLVKDALEKAGVIPNDRQIREEHAVAEDATGEPRIRLRVTMIGTLPWKSKARVE